MQPRLAHEVPHARIPAEQRAHALGRIWCTATRAMRPRWARMRAALLLCALAACVAVMVSPAAAGPAPRLDAYLEGRRRIIIARRRREPAHHTPEPMPRNRSVCEDGVCFEPGVKVSMLHNHGILFCKGCPDAHSGGSAGAQCMGKRVAGAHWALRACAAAAWENFFQVEPYHVDGGGRRHSRLWCAARC